MIHFSKKTAVAGASSREVSGWHNPPALSRDQVVATVEDRDSGSRNIPPDESSEQSSQADGDA